MMSAILRELWVISRMLATTWPTTWPPRAAASWRRCLPAGWPGGLYRPTGTVAVSSMLAAVCSRFEAVCSVRAERSWLPLAISTEAEDTASTPIRTSPTTPRSRPPWRERAQHVAQFVPALGPQVAREISRRNGIGQSHRLVQRHRDGVHQFPGQQQKKAISTTAATRL